jgi:TM2 domain-containing membrane protein YozV
MFCANCGNTISEKSTICVKCGVPNAAAGSSTSRAAYILLGIFLGLLGVHNFVAGYTGRGVAQLLLTLLTGWLIIPLFAVWLWNIIEVCVVTKDAKGNRFS